MKYLWFLITILIISLLAISCSPYDIAFADSENHKGWKLISFAENGKYGLIL